jgi:hypothetical protein
LRQTASAAALLLALLGCEQQASTPPEPTAVTTASPRPAAASNSATTPNAPPASPHAGVWTGSFEVKKAAVTVPDGVPYKTWAQDDGTKSVGAGSITLRIADDGAATGELTGALGNLTVRGTAHADELRATVGPRDPSQGDGMRGTLTGEIHGDSLPARLRASSHDGDLARLANVPMTRKRSDK